MDENEGHQARLKILAAADWWAREVMRSDKSLSVVEQKLFDAVTHYQRIQKASFEIPISLPRLPYIPKDLYNQIIIPEKETPTQRYSDVPTVPSPMEISTVDIDRIIEEIEKLDEEDILWTGKQKPE